VRTFAGETATCAIHERSFTRAAGVSPPWFGNAVADASAVPGLSTFACHGWLTPIAPGAALDGGTPIVAKVRLRFARAIRFTATAGLRQPLLVHDARPLKNSDIRGAHTHIHKSGGRQPAVGVGNMFAQTRARLFGAPPTVCVRIAVAFALILTTGGLRPPLLVVLRCGHLPVKLRLVRYTNSRLQERRASARRGLVTGRACRA
jgi:hypothetical protein